eukprot:237515_1
MSEEEINALKSKVEHTECNYSVLISNATNELCGVCNVGEGLNDCEMVLCERCDTWYHYGKQSCEYHPTRNFGLEYWNTHKYYCTQNGCFLNKTTAWDESQRKVVRDVEQVVQSNSNLNMDDIAQQEQINGEMEIEREEKEEEVKQEETDAINDLKRMYNVVNVSRSEFIKKMQTEFISFLAMWIQAIDDIIIFEQNLSLMATVFDTKLHLVEINNILNCTDKIEQKELYRKYINIYAKSQLKELSEKK